MPAEKRKATEARVRGPLIVGAMLRQSWQRQGRERRLQVTLTNLRGSVEMHSRHCQHDQRCAPTIQTSPAEFGNRSTSTSASVSRGTIVRMSGLMPFFFSCQSKAVGTASPPEVGVSAPMNIDVPAIAKSAALDVDAHALPDAAAPEAATRESCGSGIGAGQLSAHLPAGAANSGCSLLNQTAGAGNAASTHVWTVAPVTTQCSATNALGCSKTYMHREGRGTGHSFNGRGASGGNQATRASYQCLNKL